MTSLLLDIDGVLHRAASAKYQLMLDLKNTYEQIQIVSHHVPCSAVTTPDGNMVSLVVQMGDCNTPAIYQALMNHIFSAYMDNFLMYILMILLYIQIPLRIILNK